MENTKSELRSRQASSFTLEHVRIEANVSFEAFCISIDALIGKHDPSQYLPLVTDASKLSQVKEILTTQAGSSGLLLFQFSDVGRLLALKGMAVKARQYMIGNPLFAIDMLEHDIRAALYPPFRFLIYEDSSSHVVIEYDTVISIYQNLKSAKVTELAREMDQSIEKLIEDALRRTTRLTAVD